MFFFFVGGVNQQVRQVLKSGAGRCINCGSGADLVDSEKVVKVFFVPVWKWPGKEPLMHCKNCNFFFPPALSNTVESESVLPSVYSDDLRCRFCDRVVDPEFRFCPFCGSAL
ncbi:uncharacterized protein LOC123229568 [Mangifera indica]|uniref:uncharacterized protein LOC123229568 n=1 Tax=Mangifera indica TaxID=29780 RepID=UPI001CFC0EF1|nr:uncharacterized protein LOC123229568 [Mangifera indica]